MNSPNPRLWRTLSAFREVPYRACLMVAWLLVLTPGVAAAAEQAEPAPKTLAGTLQWQALPDLPLELGVAGPFVGVHNDALIVAGGANFPQQPYWENEKVWYADAWVLTRNAQDDYRWLTGFSLEHPLAYGAVASTPRGVVCMGGDDGQQVSDHCFLLTWDGEEKSLRSHPLPSLPAPLRLWGCCRNGRRRIPHVRAVRPIAGHGNQEPVADRPIPTRRQVGGPATPPRAGEGLQLRGGPAQRFRELPLRVRWAVREGRS